MSGFIEVLGCDWHGAGGKGQWCCLDLYNVADDARSVLAVLLETWYNPKIGESGAGSGEVQDD